MSTSYLWIKTFHLLFVMAWMASVFYLPRILVNIAEAGDASPPVRERLLLMGRRLYRFGHVMFGIAFILGLVLWLGYKVIPDFPTMVASGGAGWLHAKLGVVVLIVLYHWICARMLRALAANTDQHSHRWFRWFNEVPVLLLVVAVALVVVKPF